MYLPLWIGKKMADYKESSILGTQWQRCKTVIINNPLIGPKNIQFHEERVVILEGTPLRQGLDGCHKTFSSNGYFPLLDPSTNIPTGATMTHTELYTALYSLYMQTALERDASIQQA
jgi:hypothetical protein